MFLSFRDIYILFIQTIHHTLGLYASDFFRGKPIFLNHSFFHQFTEPLKQTLFYDHSYIILSFYYTSRSYFKHELFHHFRMTFEFRDDIRNGKK